MRLPRRIPKFDQAVTRFLSERAGSALEVDWRVDYDGGDVWEIRLWTNTEYQGRFRVTVDGSELID